ncbi:MAG TPA: hypothetical protein VH054_07855, partial [Polyangiaceae bacterium]|nr:hypothetical protein [Polyangiaceae bacterium]
NVGDVTTNSDAVAVGFHGVPVDGGGTIVGDLTPAASGHVDISSYTPSNANDPGRLAGAFDVVFPDNTEMQGSFDTPFCRPQICAGM